MPSRSRSLALAAALATIALGTASAADFKLASPTIKPGSTLSEAQVFNGFGCTGKNVSPALKWSGAPAGTKSYALTVYDPDAPTGSGWWHWVVYNIPASASELAEGAGTRRRQGPACRQRTRQHRLRRAGLRRRLPAQGRQAAPLHLHRLRAEDRQARHSRRRHRRAGGLHDQRQQARRGDVHREVRARQVGPDGCTPPRRAREPAVAGARGRRQRDAAPPGPTTFLLVSIGTAETLPAHSPVWV